MIQVTEKEEEDYKKFKQAWRDKFYYSDETYDKMMGPVFLLRMSSNLKIPVSDLLNKVGVFYTVNGAITLAAIDAGVSNGTVILDNNGNLKVLLNRKQRRKLSRGK